MADHFTESDIANFFEIFRRYASADEGHLPLAEATTVMLHLGHNPTVQELEKLLSCMDIEDRVFLDFPEFLQLLALHVEEAQPEDVLRTAFQLFDEDGNGTLDSSELKKAMNLLGEKIAQEEIDFMIKTADINGDGVVNYEEFIRMMFYH